MFFFFFFEKFYEKFVFLSYSESNIDYMSIIIIFSLSQH